MTTWEMAEMMSEDGIIVCGIKALVGPQTMCGQLNNLARVFYIKISDSTTLLI